MITLSAMIAFAVVAVASAVSPTAPSRGPQLRTIELDSKREKAVYKVNAAPGLATVIELPEPWAMTPTCGDCVFGDAKSSGQLWRLDLSPAMRTLSLKPMRLPGADIPPSAFVTNVDITLDGGMAITLFVELSLPESADARIEFTMADADKGAAKVTKRERELEQKFAERVAAAATDAMLESVMHGTTCKDFFGRPNRHDNIVVRLRQICRTSALIYITFEVENRRRDEISLAGAALEGTRHAAGAVAKLEKRTLQFNERGLGVAAVRSDKDDTADRYTLRVTASGVDEDTTVTVENIDF